MRLLAHNIHSANIGQVVEIPGFITGALDAFAREGDTVYLTIGGEDHEVSATEPVHVFRDAVLGALHRREMADQERGGVLTEADLDRLTDRILSRLGLSQMGAAA